MGRLKSYKDFLNEGVRDKMTPKSIGDIMSAIDAKPKNIFKIMKKIGIEEDKLYSYIYNSLPKEKIRDTFLDYIWENNEKLRSTNLNIFIDILKKLEELISLMNDNHNSSAMTSLTSFDDEVWNEVTLRLYQELTDEEMKNVIKKCIEKEFVSEAITWDFNKPNDEQRYKKHIDEVMNAKVGDVLDNDDIYQYVEYLTIQAGKYEYSFVDGDLAERIEEYSKYVLKELLLDALYLNEWDLDKVDVEEYRLKYLKGKEYPPIVVDADYSIIDGIHRANGLKRAGLTKILAFVGLKNNI
jgi:hypothetical protein